MWELNMFSEPDPIHTEGEIRSAGISILPTTLHQTYMVMILLEFPPKDLQLDI